MSAFLPQDFDWLVPTTKDLLRPDEVARYLGRKETFVYDLCDTGKLEAFEPVDREVKRKVITRRSVLIVLAEQAKTNPALFFERVLALLNHLDAHQLAQLIAAANQRRAKRFPTTTPTAP
jgi:hypothetical protein